MGDFNFQSALLSTNFGSTGSLHYISAVHKARTHASYMGFMHHYESPMNMELPISLRWLKAHNFQLLTPWHWESERIDSLKSEYYKETGQQILPFAGRQDNDTIAAFKIENGGVQETVLTIHLTWSGKRELEGYPRTQEYESIFDWISKVMNVDTQEWIDEEELVDIITNKS